MIDPSVLAGVLLVLTSFIIAARQDFRSKTVHDLSWVPAVVGLLFIYSSPYSWFGFGFWAFRAACAGLMGYYLAKKKLWGDADAIAFTLICALPSLAATAFVVAVPLVVAARDALRSRSAGFDWRRADHPLVGLMAFGVSLYVVVLGASSLFVTWVPLL